MMATVAEVIELADEVKSWHCVREEINRQRTEARQRRGRRSRHSDGRMLVSDTLPKVLRALELLVDISDEATGGDGGSCLSLLRIRERVAELDLT